MVLTFCRIMYYDVVLKSNKTGLKVRVVCNLMASGPNNFVQCFKIVGKLNASGEEIGGCGAQIRALRRI